jgi:glutathione synthase/RimK-type ligase-like ATP-grasp enzyme
LTEDIFRKEKIKLAPEVGFDLVGIDYFAESGNQLYLVEHFEMYQDALNAKKEKKNPTEYFILYKGAGGELLSR